MKITLCGSIAFHDEMLAAKKELQQRGHEVKLPPLEVEDESGRLIPVKKFYGLRKQETKDESWIRDRHREAMRNHFDKVEWSDAVLILNHEKKGIPGYIGANTLLEMGLAFHLNKKIYLLNEVPEVDSKEEILCMRPIILNGCVKIK
jgi:hypothetical protein